MSLQRAGSACLLGLALVLVGYAAQLSVVRAQEQRVEVVSKTGIEGNNLDNGEMYHGDILSGAKKDAFLKAHNEARKVVGLEPLTWSDDIARYSLDWIIENHQSYLDAARAGTLPMLKHRPKGEGKFKQKYGENLACWNVPESIETHASKAISAWLREKAAFDKLNILKPYVVGDEAGKTDDKGEAIRVGHYTQIVWKETTKIGAAMFYVKLNGKKTVVVACNYAPPGNVLGRKPY